MSIINLRIIVICELLLFLGDTYGFMIQILDVVYDII